MRITIYYAIYSLFGQKPLTKCAESGFALPHLYKNHQSLSENPQKEGEMQ